MGEKISKSWENNKNLDSYIQIASSSCFIYKEVKVGKQKLCIINMVYIVCFKRTLHQKTNLYIHIIFFYNFLLWLTF